MSEAKSGMPYRCAASDKSRQDLGKRRESRSGAQRCQHMVRGGRDIGAWIVENARGDRAVPHKGLVVYHREERGRSQRKDDLLLMLVEPVPEVGHPVSVFIGKRHRPYGKPSQAEIVEDRSADALCPFDKIRTRHGNASTVGVAACRCPLRL